MSRKLKIFLLVVLIGAQLVVCYQYPKIRMNIDFLYLIIFYVSIRMGFVKAMAAASILGLLTDYLSMGVLGVFSFSRVISSYLLSEGARFIDLRKNAFLFMLILISLLISNSVAFFFFHFIFKFPVSRQLLLIQPLTTSLVGTLLLAFPQVKNTLNVY